jgi:hypothetical protein
MILSLFFYEIINNDAKKNNNKKSSDLFLPLRKFLFDFFFRGIDYYGAMSLFGFSSQGLHQPREGLMGWQAPA